MPRKFFKRVSTQYRSKNGSPWYLKPFDYVLSHPVYFSASRRTVGGGLWTGLFIGLLPLPGQTILAVLGALMLRVNVPVAALSVWISNPLTFVPIFYLAYRIGAAMLNIPAEPFPDDPSWAWLSQELSQRWRPLLYGSFLMAISISSTVYLVFSAVWHVVTVRRYRKRHSRKIGSIPGGHPAKGPEKT